MTILFISLQISRSDIMSHIKWSVSLMILHMVTSIFLRGLCGYIWINIITLSPQREHEQRTGHGVKLKTNTTCTCASWDGFAPTPGAGAAPWGGCGGCWGGGGGGACCPCCCCCCCWPCPLAWDMAAWSRVSQDFCLRGVGKGGGPGRPAACGTFPGLMARVLPPPPPAPGDTYKRSERHEAIGRLQSAGKVVGHYHD